MADSPALNSSDVISFVISADGSPINESIQVYSVSINQSINKIPFAKIVMLDGNLPDKEFPISDSDDFKPGVEISISAGYGNNSDVIFDGVIVKHCIKITGDNFSRLIIECRDKSVAMTIGRNNANFVTLKDNAIIANLISSYSGLSADVETTNTEYNELVQYYCTDWDFMLSRAEINGLVVSIENAKLTVKAPQVSETPQLTVTYGENLIEFHADIDARTQFKKVTGISWDPKTQTQIEDSIPSQTLNQQGDLTTADLAKVIDLKSFRLQTSAPLEKSALTDWATGQQIKSSLAKIRGRIKFQGNAKAKAGSMLELAGVGERFNGNVFVSAVSHEISDGNWFTEVETGMAADWFVAQRDVVAPSASGFLPGIEGLHIGIVMKLDEDPEAQNRIQVSVPTLNAETEGVWARLASFYASNSFGAFFIPEIGDEVVLGYLNNDPSYPVILGSLYSGKMVPPNEMAAENSIKAIVTRSQLKVEFDDEKKIVTIVTPGENTIVLNDDDKSILMQDQNGNKVELASTGITMDSPKDIAISAKGKISIEATGELLMNAKSDITVKGLNISNEANVGFVAKGSASAELSASGQTTIKGAMVLIN